MPSVAALPDLAPLVAPLLGASYEEWDCWALTRHLLLTGLAIDLETEPEHAQGMLWEVWWHEDPVPVQAVMQPWDLVILAPGGLVSESVGLAVDTSTFVHTNPQTGVALAHVTRWRKRILQLAKLRSLFV
ncbi:MAG TPA: hypothetical protein VF077_12515 [Nitrospiraceae bacterium]